MRKREIVGEIIAKIFYARHDRPWPKDMLLSITSDQQREAHVRQQLQELIAPQRFAFGARGSIAATRAARDPGEALGLKPATVKTRFLRARRRLQDALAPELNATLADSFAFAGVDCESLTERVVQAWCGDATSAT
jgi:hypothetical protein